ncbi:ribose-phosphate diphosphokinase [Cohnella fermenti]|uniref:ribose-phosphate diphosphokinase n=1 Tax=Cohnella fermenti TaxID=2565925 RepID=A0A4S4C8Z6_9BACL|nr:ribose-phosphate pyrophosphokinase [Cohnella fermenti]THF84519.1 ribose-phosphate pyrophosphokinase [Cohnella fermenti]
MIWLNGEPLTFTTFPNGETLVDGERIRTLAGERNEVTFKYEQDGDLLKLYFVRSHLDDLRHSASLTVQYMPYSRMDRTSGGSVFTLKHVAKLLNAMNFDEVTILEPHSDVTPALVDRSRVRPVTLELLGPVLKDIGFDAEKDYLFFPDAGAQKRYGHIPGYKQLVGFKRRDFQTGRIEGLEVVGRAEAEGFKAVILDDLCSYGGTFLLSAERLRELGASNVYLVVAHCENSIHEGKLPTSPLIDRVYTTDTLLSDTGAHSDRIRIFPQGGY